MTRDAPRLGILTGDAPEAKMLVVVHSSETGLKWAYVRPGWGRKTLPLRRPQDFTPLSLFGVHATLNPDGLLCIHQLGLSIATYDDGGPRQWQGAADAKIQINPRIGGHVIEAVRAEFEARRTKAEVATA